MAENTSIFSLNGIRMIQKMIDGEKRYYVYRKPIKPKRFKYDVNRRNNNCRLLLREGVVNDSVESDTYTITKEKILIDVQIKLNRMVKRDEIKGGIRKERVPLNIQNKNVLEKNQLKIKVY